MRLLAVLPHELAVFTVGWANATQTECVPNRADLKHSQRCEEETPLGELQSKMVIG